MVGLLNAPGDPDSKDPVDLESAKVQAVVTLVAQSSFATVPLNADVHALLDPCCSENRRRNRQDMLRSHSCCFRADSRRHE
jgi:hypothetical protein